MGNGHTSSFFSCANTFAKHGGMQEGFLTLSRHCELDESDELGELDELGESENCCKVEDLMAPLSPQGDLFVDTIGELAGEMPALLFDVGTEFRKNHFVPSKLASPLNNSN